MPVHAASALRDPTSIAWMPEYTAPSVFASISFLARPTTKRAIPREYLFQLSLRPVS